LTAPAFPKTAPLAAVANDRRPWTATATALASGRPGGWDSQPNAGVAMGGDWSAKSARGGGNREEAYLREGKGEVLPDTASRRGPAATADGLDRWRDFFRCAGICDVIENAVLVAAADAPRELLYRRDRIAERFFIVHRRDVAAAPPPSPDSVAASATPFEEDKGSVRRVAEDCKVGSSSNDAHGHEDGDSDSDDERLRRAAASNYGHSYHDDEDEEDEHVADEEQDHEAEELEALTNEIDEESQVVGEVLRIKDILPHKEDHVCPLVYACSTAKLSHLPETI
jgi:hypothetical protein